MGGARPKALLEIDGDQWVVKFCASIARAAERWKKHFKSCGVSARDIESLTEQIDRPFLATQRRAY